MLFITYCKKIQIIPQENLGENMKLNLLLLYKILFKKSFFSKIFFKQHIMMKAK